MNMWKTSIDLSQLCTAPDSISQIRRGELWNTCIYFFYKVMTDAISTNIHPKTQSVIVVLISSSRESDKVSGLAFWCLQKKWLKLSLIVLHPGKTRSWRRVVMPYMFSTRSSKKIGFLLSQNKTKKKIKQSVWLLKGPARKKQQMD